MRFEIHVEQNLVVSENGGVFGAEMEPFHVCQVDFLVGLPDHGHYGMVTLLAEVYSAWKSACSKKEVFTALRLGSGL